MFLQNPHWRIEDLVGRFPTSAGIWRRSKGTRVTSSITLHSLRPSSRLLYSTSYFHVFGVAERKCTLDLKSLIAKGDPAATI